MNDDIPDPVQEWVNEHDLEVERMVGDTRWNINVGDNKVGEFTLSKGMDSDGEGELWAEVNQKERHTDGWVDEHSLMTQEIPKYGLILRFNLRRGNAADVGVGVVNDGPVFKVFGEVNEDGS